MNGNVNEYDGTGYDVPDAGRLIMSVPDAASVAILAKQWQNVSTKRKRSKKAEKAKGKSSGEQKVEVAPLLTVTDRAAIEQARDIRLKGRDLALQVGKQNLDRSLLHYFVNISTIGHVQYSDELDIEYICELLALGADLNARDAYAQTVLHEVAMNWDPGVMSTLVDLGGEVNAQDELGRTPLHVAASCNYPEMCRMLVKKGADKEMRTSNGQTPIFFAAKTDSSRSLRTLIGLDCEFDGIYDDRGRTPLYSAAELDRSETAAILLEFEADAFVQDKTGQIAFVPMVEKMPQVAKDALKQLHKTYRIERKQKFDLYRLDPKDMNSQSGKEGEEVTVPDYGKIINVPYHSAMKAVTNTENYSLVETPVMKNLISVQWLQYGRKRAVWQVILQLITIILWTAFAVIKEWANRFRYELPQETYRIIILTAAILMTLYSIFEEITEYLKARKRHQNWQEWRKQLLNDDLKLCRENQKDEREYLQEEIKKVDEAGIAYFDDIWNYLDWTCYVILIAALITHFVDVGYPGGEGNLVCARWHVRFLAINIVMLWVRLLKYIKPFEFFGPFIVMLGMIIGDLLKFFLLYMEFFIPFACVFWTILGGTDNLKEVDVINSNTLANYTKYNLTKVSVQYFDTVNNLLFTLFRLTLVDDYDYANMVAIDQVTAQILLGAWFAISSILFLNLFIAQLSETFKAVYDNAKAAATMQKAMTLNNFYETMMQRSQIKYHNYLKSQCNPFVVPYDDDLTEDNSGEELQKATLQIRDTVNEMKQKFDRLYDMEMLDSDGEGTVMDDEDKPVKGKSKELAERGFADVKERVAKLEEEVHTQLAQMRAMLQDIAIVVANIDTREEEEEEEEEENEESHDENDGGSARAFDRVDGRRRRTDRLPRITEVRPTSASEDSQA